MTTGSSRLNLPAIRRSLVVMAAVSDPAVRRQNETDLLSVRHQPTRDDDALLVDHEGKGGDEGFEFPRQLMPGLSLHRRTDSASAPSRGWSQGRRC